ncbi:MAG: hypothetical protein J6D09_07450 [Clostridia bacterium]|nr:hypothetical protein [Clostridia bacterium]
MQKILEELWYGNLCPIENYRESCEQMSDLIEYIKRHRKDLKDTMTDEQKAIFEKLDDCEDELENMSQREIFAYGFRLGARIAIEIMRFDLD